MIDVLFAFAVGAVVTVAIGYPVWRMHDELVESQHAAELKALTAEMLAAHRRATADALSEQRGKLENGIREIAKTTRENHQDKTGERTATALDNVADMVSIL